MAGDGGGPKRDATSSPLDDRVEKKKRKKDKQKAEADARKKNGSVGEGGEEEDVKSGDESEEENQEKTVIEEIMEEAGLMENMKMAKTAAISKQAGSMAKAFEEITKAFQKLPENWKKNNQEMYNQLENGLEEKMSEEVQRRLSLIKLNMDMTKEMEEQMEEQVERAVEKKLDQKLEKKVKKAVEEKDKQREARMAKEDKERMEKMEEKGKKVEKNFADIVKKGQEAVQAAEMSRKETEELNKQQKANITEIKSMAEKCVDVNEKQIQMETKVEEERMSRMKGSFEMTAMKGKPENLAELSEVKKSMGTGREVRGREDAELKEKLKENIKKVLEEKYNVKVENSEIEGQGWRGREEGRVHFRIKGEMKAEEVGNAVMGKWKEGGENVNAFVNKEVTWERQVRMKILREGKKQKTLEKWYQEADGGIKFTVMEKDQDMPLLQDKINVKGNGKKEVWVTPHKSNNWRMMTERDLLEAMHLEDETGATPNDAKNIRNLRPKEGHAVAVVGRRN
jgi:hypothetical protein